MKGFTKEWAKLKYKTQAVLGGLHSFESCWLCKENLNLIIFCYSIFVCCISLVATPLPPPHFKGGGGGEFWLPPPEVKKGWNYSVGAGLLKRGADTFPF